MSLPSSYQDFIHLSRYSRWLENENRRETWEAVSYTHLTLPTTPYV